MRSITPTAVGGRYKDLADIVRNLLDTVRSGTGAGTPTLQQVTTADSVTTRSVKLSGDSVKLWVGNLSTYYARMFNGGIEAMYGTSRRAAIGVGGSGSYGIVDLRNGANISYIVPSLASHAVSPYYDTLPDASGKLALTTQLPDTSQVLFWSDTLGVIATNADINNASALALKYSDTARGTGRVSSRYFTDSIRTAWMWKNTLNTFGDTGRLIVAGSQPITLGNNGRNYMFVDTGTGITAQAPSAASTLINLYNQAGASLFRVIPGTVYLSAATISVSGNITSTQAITSTASVQGSSISATNGASTLTRNTSTRGCPLIVNQNNTGANVGKNFSLQEGGVDVDTAYHGILTVKGLAGGFGSPTIADSSGVAGTTVSLVSGSNDLFGTVIITLTNPVTNASIARVTFLQSSAQTPQGITLTPVNDAAAGIKIIPVRSLWSTTGFTVRGVGLINPGTYEFTYVIGKLP